MKIRVKASAPYDIVIGKFCSAEEELRAVCSGRRVLIAKDEKVPEKSLSAAMDALNKAGAEIYNYTVPSGETSKSFPQLIDLLNAVARLGFTREDVLVALGGGVTGDLVGLAAGLYMRGIKCVQMPTTLLAAIDSSVGGKTAIDIDAGKNLVGVFHQPSLVVVDRATIEECGADNLRSGLGEAVKYGLLAGGKLWDDIKNLALAGNYIIRKGERGRANLEDLIAGCVGVKAGIVERDERESGERKLLNLGHTVGHAIEKASGYTLPHGVCVAKGIVKILNMPSCEAVDGLADEVNKTFESLGIDASCDMGVAELKEAMIHDKKRTGDGIVMAFVRAPGEPFLKKLSVAEIEREL